MSLYNAHTNIYANFPLKWTIFLEKIMIRDKYVNLEFVIGMPKPRRIPNFGSNGAFSNKNINYS